MAIDFNMNHTHVIQVAPKVQAMRFDPEAMRLGLNSSQFSICKPPLGPTESLAEKYANRFTSGPSDMFSVWLVSRTAASIVPPLWPRVPTISDYADLDSIDDMDEVENAFYEAAKRLGW